MEVFDEASSDENASLCCSHSNCQDEIDEQQTEEMASEKSTLDEGLVQATESASGEDAEISIGESEGLALLLLHTPSIATTDAKMTPTTATINEALIATWISKLAYDVVVEESTVSMESPIDAVVFSPDTKTEVMLSGRDGEVTEPPQLPAPVEITTGPPSLPVPVEITEQPMIVTVTAPPLFLHEIQSFDGAAMGTLPALRWPSTASDEDEPSLLLVPTNKFWILKPRGKGGGVELQLFDKMPQGHTPSFTGISGTLIIADACVWVTLGFRHVTNVPHDWITRATCFKGGTVSIQRDRRAVTRVCNRLRINSSGITRSVFLFQFLGNTQA